MLTKQNTLLVPSQHLTSLLPWLRWENTDPNNFTPQGKDGADGAPEQQPSCSLVLLAKMPSLQGSIQPRAEAGRKAQPRCVYRCAFALVDPMAPAKVIGTRVVLLLLGALSLRSGFPASRETCASRVSTFTHCASTGLPGCLLLRGANNFRLRGKVGGRAWYWKARKLLFSEAVFTCKGGF